MSFIHTITAFNDLLWGKCLVILLIALGCYLTFALRGFQFRYLFLSLKLAFTRNDKHAEGEISQFQSLMTALAATIGIGSIAGVATAIVAGGFGAVFWMWVIALIGMATKYAEAILAVKFRIHDPKKGISGGPMYYISEGLGWKWLGGIFALFGSLSAFAGGNMTQSNTIALALKEWMQFPPVWTGIILTIVTAFVILGGIQKIGKVCAYMVPFMALFYLIGGLAVLFMRYEFIPEVFHQIFSSAFSGQAAMGGFLGSTVMSAIQMGIARGVSSNEAGLGSAPIAAAAAKTDVPGRQALISMSGVFLSSIIVCSLTALVIGVSGAFGTQDQEGVLLNGAALVMQAFQSVIPGGNLVVVIGVILFGYSTIVGWAYYGEKCIEYLLGSKSLLYYRLVFCFMVFLGAVLQLDLVWALVDLMNGLMALPNVLGLFGLSSVVILESTHFFRLLEKEKKLVHQEN